jgi:hypothetical protein
VSWAGTWGRAESRIGLLAFAVVLIVCDNQGRPGQAGTAAGSIGPKLAVELELELAREGAGEGQKPSPLFEAYLT